MLIIIILRMSRRARVAVCLFRLRVDGTGWAARRGSRGWRGVIDRPGREDFKVSETSQECDRDCTVREVRGRQWAGEGGRRCGRMSEQKHNSKFLPLAAGRSTNEFQRARREPQQLRDARCTDARRTTQPRQCSFRICQAVWPSPVRIPSGRKIGRVAPSGSGEGGG